MITDILQIVVNFSRLKNQIMCMKMDSYLYENIYIYHLKCYKNMDQNTVKQQKYNRLKTLNCNKNVKITDVNHLSDTLEELYCDNSGINQSGISQLKYLKFFSCNYNEKVNNLNHLSDTLEKLYCGGVDCGINQYGISYLKKIKTLYCKDNTKINNVNHLGKTLLRLDCSGSSAICQDGISELSFLMAIFCEDNENIKNLNHLTGTLHDIVCSWTCSVKFSDFHLPGIKQISRKSRT